MKSDIHPLFIDHVLEKVLNSLKTPELKLSRLVCIQWALQGHQVLSYRCKTDILFGDSTRSKDLELFTKSAKLQLKLPYHTFTLQPSVFSLMRSQTLEDFIAHSIPYLKTLSLAYQENSHHLNAQTNNLVTTSLVNLNQLRFEVLPSNQFYPLSLLLTGASLFRNIFQCSENLIKLELLVSSEIHSGIDPYLETIGKSSRLVHRQLREFVLHASLKDRHLDILERLDYPFEAVQVRLRDSVFEIKSPLEFLKRHSTTLRRLKLDPWTEYGSRVNSSTEEFPQMPLLEGLDIFEWKPFSSPARLPFTFSYADTLPALKQLSIQSHHWQESFMNFFPESRSAVGTLRELKLPKHLGIDCCILVRKISSLFPRLSKLELSISADDLAGLRDVFRKLNNLECLAITFVKWDGTQCVDYVFTGIPENKCRQIYSSQDVSVVDLRDVSCGPCIADLKSLKRLQLRNQSMFSNKGRPQYTDITGYHGLIKIKCLSSLSIWPSQMSKNCINELRKRFNVTLHSF